MEAVGRNRKIIFKCRIPPGECPTLLTINSVPIEDTFAEAFPMTAARLIVTAETPQWARIAGSDGHGLCSLRHRLRCRGRDRAHPIARRNARRPAGASLLMFAFSRDALQKAAVNRVGQCILTCATTACYNGLPRSQGQDRSGSAATLRFFGDGFQFSKKLEGRRFWRLPVMDGEFTCEDVFGTIKGVGRRQFLDPGRKPTGSARRGGGSHYRHSIDPGVILPFPGGIVRSGSKVGSKYKKLRASTNDAYCPTLRGLVQSALPEGVNAVYEIVIDGLDLAAVENATRVGVQAACRPGILGISAGNYGGTSRPLSHPFAQAAQ